jgi:ribosomal-protein-alanine N-acetyltransferase
MRIPTITTTRLILRAFTEEDAEPLHHILGEAGVLRYFPNPNPPSLDRVQSLIARQLAHWQEHGYGWWATVLRESRTLIGWCGLQFLPEFVKTEVAYLLGKPYWGKGLSTEAARAAVQFGFETLELESILAIVHVDNVASRRVIEKLEMAFIEQIPLWGMECYRYKVERSTYG